VPGTSRPLSALAGNAAAPTVVEDCAARVREGYRQLKLKLGAPGALERELAGVAAVREHLGAAVQLRLDANRSLTATQLEQSWPLLARLRIDVFEEPGAVPECLAGRLPLALDESLQGADADELAALVRERHARSLVLKPTTLGGLTHCRALFERSRALATFAVISHAFEGSRAWRACAALALALPCPEQLAHGLAPHGVLTTVRPAPLPVREGRLYDWVEPGLGIPEEDE
jgi:L-alanine-DL-glutamate epimerase-like enolase superfamily enzyme